MLWTFVLENADGRCVAMRALRSGLPPAAHQAIFLPERDTRPTRRQVPTVRGLPNCEQALFAFRRLETPGGIVSTNTERAEFAVPDAAARRIANQIARTHRGTFGASAGLATVVRSVSLQMLRAGSPQDEVSRALTEYVENCSAAVAGDSQRPIDDARRRNLLVTLTANCVSDVAAEMAEGGNRRAAFATPIVG